MYLAIFLMTSACASQVATGGLMGTAAGAGTGALVGAVISRGDIAASALLGGAIGLPVGLALGYAWQQNTEEAIEQAKIRQYMKNQEMIYAQEKEIEVLREDVLRDSPAGLPEYSKKEYIHLGTGLGNVYR